MGQVRFSSATQLNTSSKGDGEEDDLYSGYAPQPQQQSGGLPTSLPSRRGTAATFRVGTAAAVRQGTVLPGSRRGMVGSRAGGAPSTSRAGVGFSIPGRTSTASPMSAYGGRTATGYRPATGAVKTGQSSVTPRGDVASWVPFDFNEQVKTAERVITRLCERSILSAAKGDKESALEKAKMAVRREKALRKQRAVYHQQQQSGKAKSEDADEEEEKSAVAKENLDLTYNTVMNLAARSAESGLWEEAIQALLGIVTNKQFRGNGRLRVNIGELYFRQRDYQNAAKQYRMALDGMDAAEHGQIRKRILRNMALCFCAQEKYNDALHLFQTFNKEGSDHLSGIAFALLGSRSNIESEKQR